MRIVVAIDSFKGSLTSLQAGEAVAAGIRRADPNADVVVRPVADGGEGTVDALIEGIGGEKRRVSVSGPLGLPVTCEYGILPDGQTAVMEMSPAALVLVPEEKRNPLNTTTYGVGEMIVDAIGQGCRRFIMGIGGSATNDGGIGMLQALGFGVLDQHGEAVPLGAKGLLKVCSITEEAVIAALSDCTFYVACDVRNPLCGDNGCSAVFAPQKGAGAEMVAQMDTWLAHYARLVKAVRPQADENAPGAGAAGGMGFALASFLNAKLTGGIELVLREIGFEEDVRGADLVITGEGRLDAQTAMGKAPMGVAAIAKAHGKPVVAFAGGVTKDATSLHAKGIDAYFPAVRQACSLEAAMEPETARANLENAAEEMFRLWRLAKRSDNA